MLIEKCLIPYVSVSYRGKVSKLHFRKATITHAGSYTCEAFNNLGKTSTIGNMTVLHDKTIHIQCFNLKNVMTTNWRGSMWEWMCCGHGGFVTELVALRSPSSEPEWKWCVLGLGLMTSKWLCPLLIKPHIKRLWLRGYGCSEGKSSSPCVLFINSGQLLQFLAWLCCLVVIDTTLYGTSPTNPR